MATPRKTTTRVHLDAVDPVWRQVRQEAEEAVRDLRPRPEPGAVEYA